MLNNVILNRVGKICTEYQLLIVSKRKSRSKSNFELLRVSRLIIASAQNDYDYLQLH